ncbi:MAG: A24 family peptidase, partial [Syntrophomonas sp.]
ISFALIYLEYGFIFYTISGWLLSVILIASAVIDINEGIIPDKITYPAIVIGLALSYFTVGVPSAILGALLFGGILLLAAIFSRGGMGGGDIKLALAIGAFTGLQGAFLAFVISSLLGGAAAISLLLGKQATLKTAIKFGPLLAIGGWLAFVYGNRLITFYLNILG